MGDGLRRRQSARREPSGLDFVVAARFPGWITDRLQFADKIRLGNPDVFAGSRPPGVIPSLRGNQSVASVVGRWNKARVLFVPQRRSGDLYRRRFGVEPETDYIV